MFEPLPTMIRIARQRQNLSYQQLAKRSGVSRRWIVQTEKGDANLSVKILLKVANALGIQEIAIEELNLGATVDVETLECAKEAIAQAQAAARDMTVLLEKFDARLERAEAVLQGAVERAMRSANPSNEMEA